MSEPTRYILGVLEGLRWLRDPLRLSPTAQLRSPSSKERFALEDFIRTNQKSGRMFAFQSLPREACILEVAVPEVVTLNPLQAADNLSSLIHDYLLRPLTLLRLFKEGSLGTRCVLVVFTGAEDRFVFQETEHLRPAPREFGKGNYDLELGEAQDLNKWMSLPWAEDLIDRPEIRWFNKAYQEPNGHDQACHLVFALEQILFRDDPDRENLRYKFPMRGAWLLGQNYETRRDVFRDLRKVHNLRDHILHGSKYGPFDKGERLLLERAEGYLRRLIALYLSRPRDRNDPSTDERILAGAGPWDRIPYFPPLESTERREPPPASPAKPPSPPPQPPRVPPTPPPPGQTGQAPQHQRPHPHRDRDRRDRRGPPPQHPRPPSPHGPPPRSDRPGQHPPAPIAPAQTPREPQRPPDRSGPTPQPPRPPYPPRESSPRSDRPGPTPSSPHPPPRGTPPRADRPGPPLPAPMAPPPPPREPQQPQPPNRPEPPPQAPTTPTTP